MARCLKVLLSIPSSSLNWWRQTAAVYISWGKRRVQGVGGGWIVGIKTPIFFRIEFRFTRFS